MNGATLETNRWEPDEEIPTLWQDFAELARTQSLAFRCRRYERGSPSEAPSVSVEVNEHLPMRVPFQRATRVTETFVFANLSQLMDELQCELTKVHVFVLVMD